MTTDARKSVGVELSESRFKSTQEAQKRAQVMNLVSNNQALSFMHEDMTRVDLSDATIIFMCSTCFSEALMQKMVDKFLALKPGLQIVTLKRLPAHPRLKIVYTTKLPTSWSSSSRFLFYKLRALQK